MSKEQRFGDRYVAETTNLVNWSLSQKDGHGFRALGIMRTMQSIFAMVMTGYDLKSCPPKERDVIDQMRVSSLSMPLLTSPHNVNSELSSLDMAEQIVYRLIEWVGYDFGEVANLLDEKGMTLRAEHLRAMNALIASTLQQALEWQAELMVVEVDAD